MKLEHPIPLLRMFDETKAREFYVDFLGFKVDWEHRFEPGTPLYMQVSSGKCVLHLSEHFGDVCPGNAMGHTGPDHHRPLRQSTHFHPGDEVIGI